MIRKFENKDISVIMEIWLAGNLQAHCFISEHYWRQNYELVSQMILTADVYVCEKYGQIVGFTGLQKNYLAGIFVREDMRSCGVGKELMDFLKQEYGWLTLDVYKRNSRAVKFYQREGFEIQCEKINGDTREVEFSMIWRCA